MPEVIIIGGGFSGLCMAIQLKRKLGMQDFLLFERGSSLGGVWANNQYPGVKCDIPSALYSLSFGQRYWKDLFSDGASIQAYIQDLASQYCITDSNAVFDTEVLEAVWNERIKHWIVKVVDRSLSANGQISEHTCKVLISATGNMSVPRQVKLPGDESFGGHILHSSSYTASIDIQNKNVVVIGNGCSAAQFVPAIAPFVKSLTIFAPEKHWILPRPTLPAPVVFDILSRYSQVGRLLLRFATFIVCESGFQSMHVARGEHHRRYQEKASKDYIARAAPHCYQEQLIPNVPFGAKRPIFDVDYLRTLHLSNVTLLGEQAVSVRKSSVQSQSGLDVPADVIIKATGFNAQRILGSMKIRGQDGLDLQEHMCRNGGITSYKGSFYSHFPNFATVYGPNTGTGHSSAIFMMECQVEMILKRMIIPVLQDEDVNSVTVKPEIEAAYTTWLRDELKE